MAAEQERDPQINEAETVSDSTPSAAEGQDAESRPSEAQVATQESGGDLDLSPVVPKKDEEEVPFEVLSVDPQPGSRIDAKVQVPEEAFEKRLETILKDLRKSVVVDGFRRGHAPLRMLRNIYGKEAQREAVEKMKDSIVPSLAKQKDWKVVGEADLRDYEAETGSPLVATYTFEIFPTIEVSDELIDGVAVDVETEEVEAGAVDAELEKLRRANATYEAKAEDQPFDPESDGVAVDLFVTDAKGSNVAELSRMDEFIGTPKESLPPEAVSALAGKKPGDHIDVKIEEGSEAGYTYHIDVQSIKTLSLPALDDEFAKDVSDKFETLDDLRKDVERDLREQKEEKRRTDSVGAVIKAILDKAPFEVPQSLVMATAAGQIEREERALAQYGIKLGDLLGDKVKGYVEAATQGAEATVKASLLMRKLADQKGFEVTDEDLDGEFERLAEKAGRTPMAIRAQYEARKRIDSLKSELLQRKVEDYLLDHAKVTYKAPEKESTEAKANEGKEPAKGKKPRSRSKAKTAEAKSDAKSDAKAEAKDQPEAKADGEAEAKPKSKPKSKAKPRAKKDSTPEEG